MAKTKKETVESETVDNKQTLEIKIKYFDDACKIKKIEKGDWIDLRSAFDKEYTQGEFFLIPLGIAMQLPDGFEAHIAPRGSTFKNYGLLEVNSVGVVDESYCGNEDQWFLPVFATRSGVIYKGDRICQFRIIEKMPTVNLVEVESLGNENRGGHGSTGVK